MGAEDVTDQPRDIHGSPIYVGDRVAIATLGPGKYDEYGAHLVVRLVTEIDRDRGLIYVPCCDGYDGYYLLEDTRRAFLRLP